MTTLNVTPWGARLGGRLLACSIGRGGVSSCKREGDGATPSGTLRIAELFYRPDRIPAHALPGWAKPIGAFDRWSDDPADPAYNHHLPGALWHPFSAEALRRPDPLYDLVLTTDWNWPDAQPGQGSAIFLHRWRKPRHPTEGCIAFAPRDLLWLARKLAPGDRLRIAG